MIPYTQLRKQPRLPLGQIVPLSKPMVVYCEVTNLCNLACVMCPEGLPDYHSRVGGKRNMSLEDLERVASELKAIGGVKALYLHCLGEPMINPLTPKFIAMVRPYVDRICLTTNGTVPLIKLLDCPPDYIRVSVYGNNQREFEQVTKSELDYRRVLDNVRALMLNRRAREQELPYIYVKSFGKFSLLHYRYKDFADEIDTEPTMNWDGQQKWGYEEADNKRVCPNPFYILTIHASMQVSACSVDWSKKLLVGDLRTQSIAEIWRGKAFEDIRLAHLAGKRKCMQPCEGCTYINTMPDNLDSLSTEEYKARLTHDI